MHNSFRALGFSTTMVFLVTVGAPAQSPIELGTDASIGILFNGGTLFSISAPIGQFRAGFRSGDNITLEPRGSLDILSGEGSTLTVFSGGLHVLYNLRSSSDSNSRLYVTGGGNIIFVDGSGASNTDVQLGGGLGVRIPVVDRLAWRLEGRLDHQFDASVTSLTGIFGISFFTR